MFAICLALGILPASAAPTLTIGQNFTATDNSASFATPPDCNGAVGPKHFVEFINGTFAVYNKTNHAPIRTISDKQFWANAHVTISSDADVTDPRIIYDPTVQRWFATQVDFNVNASDPTAFANNFLLAVSDGPEPTNTWHGVSFVADPNSGAFADFPTLGVDSNAVYISGDMFTNNVPEGASLWSLPKADLLVNTSPAIISNATFFGIMDYGVRGQVLQPATCFDGSSSGAVLAVGNIGDDSDPHSNIVSFAVQASATAAATLSDPVNITVGPYEVPFNSDMGFPLLNVMQPDGTTTLEANDARFAAKVYAVGGVLYAVHNTQLNNHVAIRWYRIKAADGTLLEQGTISDPKLDLFFPSIAANANGTVVIGCNASSIDTFVSVFAYAGQTVNGVTTFGDPVLVQSGAVSYHDVNEILAQLVDDPVTDSRWGDYSSISVDPADPNRFWTIQMYPSSEDPDTGAGIWSTQITELLVASAVPQVPQLSVATSGTNLLISWPLSAAAFQLQSTTNLGSANSWGAVNQPLSTNGSVVSVLIPESGSQNFFRLKQ
jgi:hypothetical protein